MPISGFEYAQARIQARYARRPSESVWTQLDAAQGFAAYLEGARTTVLRPWVESLSGRSDVHDVEHSIRGTLYTSIHTTARWVPGPWSGAVTWLQWLVYLPALEYLLGGGRVLAWMREGHRLRPYLADSSKAREQALAAAGGAYLVEAWESERTLLAGWLDGWRASWPRDGSERLAALQALTELLVEHVRRFSAAPPASGWSGRRSLAKRLELRFRRHALTPAAVFAYLALLALDLERLRGGLVRRVLFP